MSYSLYKSLIGRIIKPLNRHVLKYVASQLSNNLNFLAHGERCIKNKQKGITHK